jgi:hypothetical protein
MIIFVPVQTAVWPKRPEGAPASDVEDHVSVAGLYRPPVFAYPPPQTIISVPVQTAEWPKPLAGALVVDGDVHVSAVGS